MLRKQIALSVAMLTVALPVAGHAGVRGDGGYDDPVGREHDVEMDDFAFRPARITVNPGQLVVWKNSDRAPHNATALTKVAGKPAFRTRTGGKDALLTARAPRRKGTYRYLCTTHPRMRGTLVVR